MPKEGGPGQEGATRGIAVLKGTSAHNAFARLQEENARQLRRGRRLEAIFRLGGLRSIFDTTIYHAISSGDLKSLKIGARRLVAVEALREWLLKHEVKR